MGCGVDTRLSSLIYTRIPAASPLQMPSVGREMCSQHGG